MTTALTALQDAVGQAIGGPVSANVAADILARIRRHPDAGALVIAIEAADDPVLSPMGDREQGLSLRAIGQIVGVSHPTVLRAGRGTDVPPDLEPAGPDGPPELEPAGKDLPPELEPTLDVPNGTPELEPTPAVIPAQLHVVESIHPPCPDVATYQRHRSTHYQSLTGWGCRTCEAIPEAPPVVTADGHSRSLRAALRSTEPV